jgi:hypothetical protein|tara:strand:- start:613 stop:1404 length:792 start_codon:yes stop_codon:yes gene_type:complete
MSEPVDIAIKDYYTLKKKYEKKITNAKNKIRNSKDLTKKDKRLRVKQIKKTCINCGNKGGTIFKTDNNMLIATCGCKTPCALNINIDRGKYTNIRNTEQEIHNEIKGIKQTIMRLKLDLLFNYSDENTILNDFKKQKTELSNFTQSLVIYRKDYISIVDNEDKSKAIKDDTIKLYELSDQLKKLKTDYNSNKNETNFKDMVEIYVRDIKPLIERLQSVKYKHSYINTNELDNTSELIQSDYIYSDLFIPLNSQNNAKIITNKN